VLPLTAESKGQAMTKFRAMRIHSFGGAPEADDVELPLPDASQVLIATKAASVNPVDFKIRSGKYPAVKENQLPYTLGRDASGIVEQCGARATAFKVGDEVFGIVGIGGGGYARKVVLDQDAITAKPPGIDHAHAAAIPLAGQTAWQGLFKHGGLKAGQSVLIHGGSGGVGHFAIQFAKVKGARVLTTVSTANVAFAKQLGADIVIDYKAQRFEDHASGLDMVLDLIGGDTQARSWKTLKPGGILVSTLQVSGQTTAQQVGVRASHYGVEADGKELAEIAALVAAGKVKPHIEKNWPLEEAAVALAEVEAGHSVGKVVLVVD
jgi:NADPH:quinone reductase-like Zn-dependent oxidoreductase